MEGTDDVESGTTEKDAVIVTTAAKSNLAFTAASIVSGAAFGVGIYQSGVYRTDILRSQFDFSCNIMLKVFLSASVTSMICFALIHATGIGASNLTNCEKDGLKNKYGVPALFAGGACLGAGMFVSGACPGIVMAQMGAGAWRSIATFGGCVFASFAMVALAPSLERAKGALNYTVGKPERIALHTLLLGNSRKHRLIMSTLIILCMTGVIVLAEVLSPGLGQLEIKDAGMKAAWHPIICGAIIGLMQIPLMLTGGKQLGSSYAYIVIVGIITFPFSTCLPKRFKKGIEGGILNMYKLPFLVTAAISALVVGTVFASTSPFPYTVHDVTIVERFIGGCMLISGANFCGGCTSGHGISGTGHLRIKSFIVTCAMFAGGICASQIYSRLGA
eukprot:g4911.t1